MKRIVIVGAGGHARDTRWVIDAINAVKPTYECLGFIVSDRSRLGSYDSVDEVLGEEDWLTTHRGEVDALALGIGNPLAREVVARRLEAAHPELEWPPLVHPNAMVDHPTNAIAHGVLISAGVIATVHCVIEAHAVLNPSVTLGHEARVGRCSVMNHASGISGGTSLGACVLVGTGARVLQYLHVGQGARVGAGAVVTRDVAEGTTVVGVPARPRKEG